MLLVTAVTHCSESECSVAPWYMETSSVIIDVVRCRSCLANLTVSVGEYSQVNHAMQLFCVRGYGFSELLRKRTQQVSECAVAHHVLDPCDADLAVHVEK